MLRPLALGEVVWYAQNLSNVQFWKPAGRWLLVDTKELWGLLSAERDDLGSDSNPTDLLFRAGENVVDQT